MSALPPGVSAEPLVASSSQQRRVRFAADCIDIEKDIEDVEAIVLPTDEEMSEHSHNFETASTLGDVGAATDTFALSPTLPPRAVSSPHSPHTPTASLAGRLPSFPISAPDFSASTPTRDSAQTTVNTFIKNQDTQTPAKIVSTDTVEELGTVEEMRKRLAVELGDRIPEVKISWVLTCYDSLVRTTRIQHYLDTAGHYRGGRWVGLPEVAEKEYLLYDPFCRIINSILEYFHFSGYMGSKRKAIGTHKNYLKHGGLKANSHRSSPDISIRASGPSFVRPTGVSVGFSNLASCFDGKRDKDVNPEDKHVPQLGVYARQVFIYQPNRRYVRFMIVTEQRARVVHFDRSGAQYTELFDIHAEPIWFVQLVLGLCTNDERLLGLDDTIKWTVGSNGTRTGGTLRTIGPDKTPITYTLSTDEATWYRSSLCGRGMVCWPVKDKDGNRLVVKDYWMSEGRDPEYELLEKAKDIPGICEIVAHEVGRGETRDFRGALTDITTAGDFHNCIAIRITLKAYGTSIDNFTSPEEMLAALRDAIAAHQALVKEGFFHRDICHNTVLLAKQGIKAELGRRGILMDLDMAIGPVRPESDEFAKRFKLGIVLFQPAIILKALSLPDDMKCTIPAHDCLDDVESFFWLFCYLILVHNPTGGTGPENYFHAQIRKWMGQSIADESKILFLISNAVPMEAKKAMYPGWQEVCMDLFLGFREIVGDVYWRKSSLLYNEPEPLENGTIPNRFAEVLEDVDDIYEQVLGLFDDALKKALSQSARNAGNQANDSINPDSTVSSGPNADAIPGEHRWVRPRTRSMRRLPVPEEAPAATASGSNKRHAADDDSDENEESPTPSKRVCPPSRVAGTSALSQFDGSDSDD